jgi:hypothetical protein
LLQLIFYPFAVKLLVDLDKSRKAALLLLPLSYVGLSAGPFVCSWFVESTDVSAAYWVASIAALGSGLVFGLTKFAPRYDSYSEEDLDPVHIGSPKKSPQT